MLVVRVKLRPGRACCRFGRVPGGVPEVVASRGLGMSVEWVEALHHESATRLPNVHSRSLRGGFPESERGAVENDTVLPTCTLDGSW